MSTTPIPTWMQDEVLERDNWTCLRCKKRVYRWRGAARHDSASVDHIVPDNRIHRGLTEVDNLQTLCRDCNSWKGARVIDFRPHAVVRTPHEVFGDLANEEVSIENITAVCKIARKNYGLSGLKHLYHNVPQGPMRQMVGWYIVSRYGGAWALVIATVWALIVWLGFEMFFGLILLVMILIGWMVSNK